MIKYDYHHGNLKEEFLQIAFDFILKNSVEKLTLKILSDATGTSRSAIYRHFKNKDELIETIIINGFKQFDDYVSPTLRDKNISLVDRFYLGTKLYIEFARSNPNLYRLLFGKKYAHIREEALSIKDKDCNGFGILKQIIEEGQQSGIVKKEDSYKQAIIVWASLHGLSSLVIDGFMDVEEIYKELYSRMFESLLAGLIEDRVKILSTIPFVKNILQPKLS